MPFEPIFQISAATAAMLMRIEGLKENIKALPLTPKVIKTLRETAKIGTVHYSTMIEGNRLSKNEVAQVIREEKHFPNRERDEKEILGYYAAMEWVEKNIKKPINEETVKIIHALIEGSGGKNTVKPTPWRDGQNVIKDSASGRIVYMPPEAKDVPLLMQEFIAWLTQQQKIPVPILAAITHYQLVTIHPWYDGNGRTARLLTTLVLHQGGYDLNGLYSLEEYYARDLAKYYEAISIGDSHNYYFGRAVSDITPWIDYFVSGMLDALEHVKLRVAEASIKGEKDKSSVLRTLSPKQRRILTLFEDQSTITSKDVAELVGFNVRSARLLCNQLVKEDFLIIGNPAPKTRTYKLHPKYETLFKL